MHETVEQTLVLELILEAIQMFSSCRNPYGNPEFRTTSTMCDLGQEDSIIFEDN